MLGKMQPHETPLRVIASPTNPLHLLHVPLVEDFLNGDELDDSSRSSLPVERAARAWGQVHETQSLLGLRTSRVRVHVVEAME